MEKLKTGNILISEPFMDDPNFKRTVVLIADYSKKEGCVGFVLNRKLDYKISDLIPDIENFDADVYYGGPVGQDTIHFIHSAGELIRDAVKLSKGVYWGGNLDELLFLINTKYIVPNTVKFFIGYSGWGPEQLDEEYKLKTWIQSEMDPNFIFNPNILDLWKISLDLKGGHYSALSEIQTDVISN